MSPKPVPRPTLTPWCSAACLALAGCCIGLPVWAQNKAGTGSNAAGIYTCVDSKGRRLTSDRPIIECLDREQRVLGNTGTTKRVVPPSYTADERARMDAERRKEQEAQARLAEEKRRDKALLIRYPNKAVHDKERTDALLQIDDVMQAVSKRLVVLQQDRKQIDAELEFYKGDASKAPPWLKRQIEDNEQQVKVQRRFLDDQQQEKQRISLRFDEELGKLRQLWDGGLKP